MFLSPNKKATLRVAVSVLCGFVGLKIVDGKPAFMGGGGRAAL
jgi:hypothetical protein